MKAKVLLWIGIISGSALAIEALTHTKWDLSDALSCGLGLAVAGSFVWVKNRI